MCGGVGGQALRLATCPCRGPAVRTACLMSFKLKLCAARCWAAGDGGAEAAEEEGEEGGQAAAEGRQEAENGRESVEKRCLEPPHAALQCALPASGLWTATWVPRAPACKPAHADDGTLRHITLHTIHTNNTKMNKTHRAHQFFTGKRVARHRPDLHHAPMPPSPVTMVLARHVYTGNRQHHQPKLQFKLIHWREAQQRNNYWGRIAI